MRRRRTVAAQPAAWSSPLDGILDLTAPPRGDGNDDDNLESTAASYGYNAFVNDVVSFLDGDGASHCGDWGGGGYTGAVDVGVGGGNTI